MEVDRPITVAELVGFLSRFPSFHIVDFCGLDFRRLALLDERTVRVEFEQSIAYSPVLQQWFVSGAKREPE